METLAALDVIRNLVEARKAQLQQLTKIMAGLASPMAHFDLRLMMVTGLKVAKVDLHVEAVAASRARASKRKRPYMVPTSTWA